VATRNALLVDEGRCLWKIDHDLCILCFGAWNKKGLQKL